MTMMTWAILLLLLGLLFLASEVFIPSGGILMILSVVALLAGITMIFNAPPSEGGGPTSGLIAVTILLILIPAVVGVMLHYWPRTKMGKRFFLPEQDADATIAATDDFHELEQFQGQVGKTVTPLRPSGVALIGGHRIDSKTEGMYVEAGQWVRVVEIHPGHVVVRPMDEREIENLDEMIS